MEMQCERVRNKLSPSPPHPFMQAYFEAVSSQTGFPKYIWKLSKLYGDISFNGNVIINWNYKDEKKKKNKI